MNDTTTPAPSAPVSRRSARPKVPPFARYQGTSAWRKDRKRVRAYAMFLAAQKLAAQKHGATPGA